MKKKFSNSYSFSLWFIQKVEEIYAKAGYSSASSFIEAIATDNLKKEEFKIKKKK